uniref:Homeobox domain-containing protein n=2 Tax=Araucaria cunninghamii TaxID=56994 RepID=A0A0D6R661_ARACU
MNEGSGLKVGSTATWLNSLNQHPSSHVEGGDGQSMMGFSTHHSHGSTIIDHSSAGQGRGLLDLHSDTANSSDLLGSNRSDGDQQRQHPHGNPNPAQQQPPSQQENSEMMWQNSRLKADIMQHPLYDQLLDAHVACLRIATPLDQLPKIDAQLSQSRHVVAKYSVLGRNQILNGEEKEDLDRFLAQYVLLLSSFKEQLQQHVRVHAREAVIACWELEQSLLSLTGVSPGEGTGATMSDDEDDQADSEANLFDFGLDGQDSVGAFGPLIPTENERSLMERVRQELKHELKQGYRSRIEDIREEILRKRRAGKLPGDTTTVLKTWWQQHSKWPYPTEDEKARLVQETGLHLKQINNWFINQRKRNWHSNPSSSSASNAKRKRGT